MIFDSIHGLVRIVVVGSLAYAWLVLVLRISGKRTLAKLNAFDLVVTVSLGSVLASVAVTSEVSLTEGALALGLLCGAQFLVAWSSIRSRWVRRMAKSDPVLLARDGAVLADVLRRERLTEGEVRQAVRSSGAGSLQEVAAVVLETDGSLSVIGTDRLGTGDALRDVIGAELGERSGRRG